MKKYKSSEIIFGTRESLLDFRDKLLLLEELTTVQNRKDVKKVIYEIASSLNSVERDKGINQRFLCSLYGNSSFYQDVMDFLRFGYLFRPTTGIGDSVSVIKNNNGEYMFEDPEFNQYVSITDQDRFKEIIEEIQDSDFFNEMAFKKIYSDSDNRHNMIRLGSGGIQIWNAIKGNKFGELYYNPKFDLIESIELKGAKLFRPKTTEREVQELLDVEVDGSLLSDYQRSLIDNSEAAKKPIIIDNCSEKIAYFGIEENEDSIHLVKRKRKSLRF